MFHFLVKIDNFTLGPALILPPLSSHLKGLGLASWQRGIPLSSYGILQFVSGPAIGSVSDAGDRKKVFLICTLCTGRFYKERCQIDLSSLTIKGSILNCSFRRNLHRSGHR